MDKIKKLETRYQKYEYMIRDLELKEQREKDEAYQWFQHRISTAGFRVYKYLLNNPGQNLKYWDVIGDANDLPEYRLDEQIITGMISELLTAEGYKYELTHGYYEDEIEYIVDLSNKKLMTDLAVKYSDNFLQEEKEEKDLYFNKIKEVSKNIYSDEFRLMIYINLKKKLQEGKPYVIDYRDIYEWDPEDTRENILNFGDIVDKIFTEMISEEGYQLEKNQDKNANLPIFALPKYTISFKD